MSENASPYLPHTESQGEGRSRSVSKRMSTLPNRSDSPVFLSA